MPKTHAKKTSTKRKPNAAFMKPVQPDDKLSAIVGSKPLPRSELTKKLWDYIKKNGLQDKKKRTQINADETMKPGLQWQEPGQHVRDDQAGLGPSAIARRLTTGSGAGAPTGNNFCPPANGSTVHGRAYRTIWGPGSGLREPWVPAKVIE